MSTTRKKAPGKAQPAAALRTRPPSRKSAKPPIATAELIQGEALRPLRIELDPAFKVALDDLKALIQRQTTLDYATGIATLGATTVGAAPSVCGAASFPQGMPVVGPGELRSFASSDAMAAPPTRPYVLLYRDNRFDLIGPFGTSEEAADWSRSPVNNPQDDPRWQVLLLPQDRLWARQFTPWAASLEIQAGNL